LILSVGQAYSATEFVASVRNDGAGDFSTLSAWEASLQCDLTSATTLVYSGTLTGIVNDNAAVTLYRSGVSQSVTATVVHANDAGDQILLETISNTSTPLADDQWRVDASNYFTISDTGDSAIATAKIDGAWTTADTTAVTISSSWTTSAAEYIRIYTTAAARHNGKWDDTKYRLEATDVSDSGAINVDEEYVRIEGLQISIEAAGFGSYMHAILINVVDSSATAETRVSHSILKRVGTDALDYHGGIWIDGSHWTLKAWNNILYDFQGATQHSQGLELRNEVKYVYNNTIYNCECGVSGISNEVVAKNNIVQSCTNVYDVTFDSASTHNITETSAEDGAWGISADSGTTDGIGTDTSVLRDTGQNFLTTVKAGMIIANTTDSTYTYVTAVNSDTELAVNDDFFDDSENFTIYTNLYGSVSFVNETGDDFHLSASDSMARDNWSNVYADASLAVTDDIVGSSRPNSTSGDIGADECAVPVFYSVGTSTSDLKTGSPTLTISSGTATFTVEQANNVGVGDKVTYDTSKIAYISARTSSLVYTLITATGASPADESSAVTVNSIMRAFNHLDDAVDAVDGGVCASDATHLNTTDLVTGNYILNIPCYADAADENAVTVEGWTTGADNYIKIYTPVSSIEVGVTQRHSGVWDDGKYRITTNQGYNTVTIAESYTQISGIQVQSSTNADNTRRGIYAHTLGVASLKINNNIVINGNASATDRRGISVSTETSAPHYIYNNILYGHTGSGISLDTDYGTAPSYIYNNTVYDTGICFSSGEEGNSFKNNIAQSCTDGYAGTFDASSDYNISDVSQADADSVNTTFDGYKTVTFTDSANNNFHLSSTDTAAKDAGADLSSDSNLAFSDDIEENTRGTNWDIGADECNVN
ncbi:MAG: hypothetical protein DRP78_07390, partial [Candidatus Omnitrophota bacterium]